MSNSKIIPFLKWAGGKRQLLPKINEKLPTNYNCFYEPFVGAGAVLFDVQPRNAYINDINKPLINTYIEIRDNPNEFIEKLNSFDLGMWEDGKEYYYNIRKYFNNKLQKEEYDTELAALLVFINKHCFNGLYRVNKKGEFNVPYNNNRGTSFDKDIILSVSGYLKQVNIQVGDFEEACKMASEKDFVFIDSPYVPTSPTSFESYTKEGFDLENHKRLASLFDELTERGCYCMLTNHNTELIQDLYGKKGYKMEVVNVKRLINSNASNRVGTEIIIQNY